MGRLYTGFKQAAAGLANSEHAIVPWNVLRQLAIDLNNTEQAPREAEQIVNALLSVTEIPIPSDVAKALAADKRKLTQINLTADLISAMKAGNHQRALLIINNLLEPITDDSSELNTVRGLRAKIEGEIGKRRIKYFVWGGIAAFILLAAFLGNNNSPPSRTSTYSQAATNPTQETMPPTSSGPSYR